ncbi:uncharacterized protein TA03825 [Theileria annulata]|uniref:Uncharacterized protein n=1 Tax=Theileria annulata TaxID=5874 RepID=Q4UCD8_THEAN|nr:uncharacterized protein TA03825 [Theileria annulata]CAI75513.1 hypothetical protein TA03825 [Theileria annulata]|eukprot:XP_954989.1 hypothetical protein TA03825 [Theileria annulata]
MNLIDEIMDMIEKMSSIMLYYSRLNIFKRVGMNAEYCKRIYNRTMEFFFLIFLQNPTLSNRNFINKFDCKNITEIGIITLSILRVLSYNIFIIFSVTVLGHTESTSTEVTTTNSTKVTTTNSTNNTTNSTEVTTTNSTEDISSTTGTVGASTVTQGKGANFTAMECTPGKGANFTAMECTPGKGANSMGTKCTTKDTKGVGVGTEEGPFGGVGMTKHRNGGLIGILNIFYAILLSFHIKSLVLMINVWYPTDTILIVIELYIYLNHIIELKIICNISLFSSIFIIISGAIIKIFIYFLWFHIINKFKFITFLSIK